MALVGMLTALVAPRLWTWTESARHRSLIDTVVSRFQNLPSATFFAGRARLIDSADDLPVELPSGWRLELPQPIRYEANGMCGGGRVLLWSDSRLLGEWNVLAPSGRVIAVEAQP